MKELIKKIKQELDSYLDDPTISFNSSILETVEELIEEYVDTEKDEVKEDLEHEFEANPGEFIDNKKRAIAILLEIDNDPSLADEIKIEWFKNNYSKIDPYKDL